MCYALQSDGTAKNGQIAHLDKNRNNNKLDNLAWLCLAHHDDYDSTRRQTRNFTPAEVKRYRAVLLDAIKQGIVPVGYSQRGASLRMSARVGLVERTRFENFGAEIRLAGRLSNSGNVETGIELARFSWNGEMVADENVGIPLRYYSNGRPSKPDRENFPEFADYLTLAPDQLFGPGRCQHIVVPLAVPANSSFMSIVNQLKPEAVQFAFSPPALLELVPVIGAPVAAEVSVLRWPRT
ncbi:MAG: hypothetical protein KIS61_31615 [Candidatus Eremiobacteraeota bacterium]|nr:hypothetical protein [Candidatus Eremiobacteraeota bacterium]